MLWWINAYPTVYVDVALSVAVKASIEAVL